jgi:protein phosphatase
VVHIGDSRAYVLQGRKFSQVTRDQTYVQALVDEGRITEEEARNHPQRSVILRAMTGSEVDPDLSIREAHLGDRYLICSDGLSDYVSGDTIAETLRMPDPHAAADRLIELALRAGGRDNITVIVADIVDAQDGDDEPIIDGAASDTIEDREVHPTSAAARAAIAIPPGQGDPDPAEFESVEAEPARRGGARRRLFVAVGALVVVVGGLVGLYEWSQAQYFVGASGGRVTVFKGVNMSLAGARLYHPVHTSDLAVDDLVSTARDKVRSGLSTDSRSGADKIISNLNKGELLPVCPPPPTPTPTATPSHRPAASRPSGHPTAKRPAPRPTTQRPRPTHAAATAPALNVAVPTPVPGKDCR